MSAFGGKADIRLWTPKVDIGQLVDTGVKSLLSHGERIIQKKSPAEAGRRRETYLRTFKLPANSLPRSETIS